MRVAAGRPGPARPWASLVLSLSAGVLHLLPSLGEWAAFDRGAIAAGQLWRLLTGHWAHWSAEHLGWDLLVFAVAGGLLESRGRRRAFLLCALLSALLISAGVWVLQPGMTYYRGLSGIDCALVTLLGVDLLRQSTRAGQRGLSVAVAGLLAGYLLKVAFELATGQTLFVDSEHGAFVPVPLAHVLGGLLGLVLSLSLAHGPHGHPEPHAPRSGVKDLPYAEDGEIPRAQLMGFRPSE